MLKPGRESDRAAILEGQNGTGSFSQSRIGRGEISCSNWCLSVFGCLTPSSLPDFVGGANDGWSQRYQLGVYPDPVRFALIDEEPDVHATEAVASLAETIANMRFTEHGAHAGVRPYFQFSDKSPSDAQSVFLEWFTRLELDKIRNLAEPPEIRVTRHAI